MLSNSFTGYTSSKRHKSNGVDGVLEENEASEMPGNITNDGSIQTNHEDGSNKGWIPVHQTFGFTIFFWIPTTHGTKDSNEYQEDIKTINSSFSVLQKT